ncbi:DnaJ homolog subfamily C member 17, partial [Tanacetum coccineum]
MVVIFVDHYTVLGLPTGEKGLNLSSKDIKKAYKLKALELHPDKKPNNPNAVADFQKLQASFDILKDEKMVAEMRKRKRADEFEEIQRKRAEKREQDRKSWKERSIVQALLQKHLRDWNCQLVKVYVGCEDGP